MCGLVGAVGVPKNNIKSYTLLTHLMRETKKRGPHATGYFSINEKNEINTHKAPMNSHEYVKTSHWKKNFFYTKAILGHTRFTTQGSAKDNENNHPHLSKDGNTALVHNGVLYLYSQYANDYKESLESECDSELIIRIIEQEPDIISGIKKVFKLLGPGGDFACEILSYDPITKKSKFYFFREDGRPGKMIDARESMGQIFFCSEEIIWKTAVNHSALPKSVKKLKVQNINVCQIIEIDTDTLEITTHQVPKPVKTKKTYSSVNYSGGYWNSRGYDDWGDDWYSKRNNNYQRHESSNESCLDDHWIETKNDLGLPRFVYDPHNKIRNTNISEISTQPVTVLTEDDEDEEEYIKQLRECVEDPLARFPGWEDEALAKNIITNEEHYKLTNEIENFEGDDLSPYER